MKRYAPFKYKKEKRKAIFLPESVYKEVRSRAAARKITLISMVEELLKSPQS